MPRSQAGSMFVLTSPAPRRSTVCTPKRAARRTHGRCIGTVASDLRLDYNLRMDEPGTGPVGSGSSEVHPAQPIQIDSRNFASPVVENQSLKQLAVLTGYGVTGVAAGSTAVSIGAATSSAVAIAS